eukprot:m.228940 g.228940  ORF g.228940 m.228940 type:complete len:62 (-) comp54254_c0_seq1:357-542(-)
MICHIAASIFCASPPSPLKYSNALIFLTLAFCGQPARHGRSLLKPVCGAHRVDDRSRRRRS